MAYADPELILKRWLISAVFPGTGQDRVRVEVGDLTPEEINFQQAQRLIRIVQLASSPGDTTITLDVADLELNWYARNRQRVRELTDQTRVAMRYQLEGVTDPDTGAFIKQARWLSSPADTPSESSMFRRRTATARLWIHHNPL